MAGKPENGGGGHDNRWRIAIWGTAALVLLLPALAMQFTEEVDWDFADFAVFGAMLVAACGTYELASRLTHNRAYRAAVGVALAAAFILIWITLAVGIDAVCAAEVVFVGEVESSLQARDSTYEYKKGQKLGTKDA